MTERRRSALLVAAVLLAGSLTILAPALFSSDVLSAGDKLFFQTPFLAERPAGLERPSNFDLSDAVDVFHPHLLEAREAVRAGELPAWNAHIEAGRPVGAQNGGPFYPLHWLAYVLPFWQSLELIALLKLLIAGSGAFVLLRRLGLGAGGATFGAVSFAFGVPFVVSLEHPQAVVFGLLPWLLAASDWMVRGRGGARAVLACGGLMGVAQLAGHPESTFVLVSGFLAFAAFRAFEPGVAELRPTARRLGLQILAVAMVAFAVAAVTLIPTLLLLRDSVDSDRNAPALGLSALQAAFFPEAWGRPDKIGFEGPAGTSYAYRAMYIGAVPLVLALAGMVARRSGLQLFFAATAAVCGLLLLNVPVVPEVIGKLPVFSLVNEWHFIFLAIFCGSMLAGIGLDILLRGDRRERRRLALAAAAVALAPVAWLVTKPGALGQWRDLPGNFPVLGESVGSPELARLVAGSHWIVFAGLGALLALVAWRRRSAAPPWVFAGIAVALALGDLVPLGLGYHPAVPERLANPAPTRSIAFLQENAGFDRVAGAGPALYPNAVQRYGLADARGEDLPERERFGKVWTGFGGDFFQEFGLKVVQQPGAGRAPELLDLMSVRYLVDAGGAPVPAGLRTTAVDEPGQRVLENPDALPRAWVAYGARPAEGAAAAIEQTVASSVSELQRSPVIEADGASLPSGGAAPSRARMIAAERGHMEVAARARTPGLLVVTDSWDGGWGATVDGEEADVLPANGGFRAVALPAGRHVVEFDYRSRPLIAAAVVSLLGMVGVVAGIAVLGLRGRRARELTAQALRRPAPRGPCPGDSRRSRVAASVRRWRWRRPSG